ncbi:hypothetical protein V8E36_000627 [Tilletia maclaganii]
MTPPPHTASSSGHVLRSGSKRPATSAPDGPAQAEKQQVGQIFAQTGSSFKFVLKESVPAEQVPAIRAQTSIEGIKMLEADLAAETFARRAADRRAQTLTIENAALKDLVRHFVDDAKELIW